MKRHLFLEEYFVRIFSLDHQKLSNIHYLRDLFLQLTGNKFLMYVKYFQITAWEIFFFKVCLFK